MRGLLIVLCALATTAAALAGGCTFLFAGVVAVAAPNQGDAAAVLTIALPVLGVTAAVAVVNVALIVALASGRAPRRSVWFVLLAVVDFAVAGFLLAISLTDPGLVQSGNVQLLFLPAVLTLKGLLTLLLPRRPSQPPPFDPRPA